MASVLILGGGVGGLVAANRLRKALPKEHRITLVDRQPNFIFAPSFLWVMIGNRKANQISRPLSKLTRKGIEVMQGEIERIDPRRREVVVNGKTLAADHVIISLGADLAPETIPGLTDGGHNFYTLSGAQGFNQALSTFSGGRIVILTAAPAYKCPAAPYEAAMLVESFCRKRKIREKTEIALYAAEPGPMGVAGPEVSRAVRQMVETKGIHYHPEHQVSEVDPSARTLKFSNNVSTSYDLLAFVPPHRAPKVLKECGLTGESGWIAVDRHTLETTFSQIHALGDSTGIPLKLGKPLPKAGVFAHGQAEVIAQNIALSITGKGDRATFDGEGECFIETGDGQAGFGKGNFYAEPTPQVKIHPPGRRWHVAKILFEKDWLRRWF